MRLKDKIEICNNLYQIMCTLPGRFDELKQTITFERLEWNEVKKDIEAVTHGFGKRINWVSIKDDDGEYVLGAVTVISDAEPDIFNIHVKSDTKDLYIRQVKIIASMDNYNVYFFQGEEIEKCESKGEIND
jgi:hypothetical protein